MLIDYPPAEAETEVLRRYHGGFDAHDLVTAGLERVITPADIARCRAEISAVTVEPGIMNYVTQIAVASRRSPDLILGGSPRASIYLLLASKTYAALQGRSFVIPDDVKALAAPVYRHRIILKPEAEIEGLDADAVVRRILAKVEVPR